MSFISLSFSPRLFSFVLLGTWSLSKPKPLGKGDVFHELIAGAFLILFQNLLNQSFSLYKNTGVWILLSHLQETFIDFYTHTHTHIYTCFSYLTFPVSMWYKWYWLHFSGEETEAWRPRLAQDRLVVKPGWGFQAEALTGLACKSRILIDLLCLHVLPQWFPQPAPCFLTCPPLLVLHTSVCTHTLWFTFLNHILLSGVWTVYPFQLYLGRTSLHLFKSVQGCPTVQCDVTV